MVNKISFFNMRTMMFALGNGSKFLNYIRMLGTIIPDSTH